MSSSKRHHITVDVDRSTGEWLPETIKYAGEVDVDTYVHQQDTTDVFHTMHYLTHKIVDILPADSQINAKDDIDIAVTITKR